MSTASPLVWAVEGRNNTKQPGADHVEVTLKTLSPDRIGHGVRSAEDPTVLARLVDAGVARPLIEGLSLVAEPGSICSETAAAPETVSACVPATAPEALAVKVAVPELVSS